VKLQLADGSRLTEARAKKLADDVVERLSVKGRPPEYAVLVLGAKLRTARKLKGLTRSRWRRYPEGSSTIQLSLTTIGDFGSSLMRASTGSLSSTAYL
jgi:hypothetical protein